MASSRSALPVNTSCKVILGYKFSTTSRLARPKSASSTKTFRPWRVSAAAKLALTKVLPTPPLPLVIATVRATRVVLAGELDEVVVAAVDMETIIPWCRVQTESGPKKASLFLRRSPR